VSKHPPLPNLPFSRAMQALRMSSATDRHADGRTRRARTRAAAKVRAVRDQQ
jgi:hypothetical protein